MTPDPVPLLSNGEHYREFAQFLHTARGSLSELHTHLEIAVRLGYLACAVKARLQAACDQVDRLLNGLIRSFNP
jgi:four helix bundle protein